MTDPTPLTPESEALLAHASIRARFLNDVTMGKPRPGSIPWLRDELIAIEAAVTARVLADVAARLPEALAEALHREFWVRDMKHAPSGDMACWDMEAGATAHILAHLTGGTDR
mgnify:CR=1 FL=1